MVPLIQLIYTFNVDFFRYYRLKYEDLVSDPMRELRRVYAFTGVALTDEGTRLTHELTHTDARDVKGGNMYKGGYFSVHRGEGYRHDAWRQKLSLDVRLLVRKLRKIRDFLHR